MIHTLVRRCRVVPAAASANSCTSVTAAIHGPRRKQQQQQYHRPRHQDEQRSYYHATSPKHFPDIDAITDLFSQYAKKHGPNGEWALDAHDICELLQGVGREKCLEEDYGMKVVTPNSFFVTKLFDVADIDNNGLIDIDEFIEHAYAFIGDNPASIILVVGGPGSGKGVLSDRLEKECNVVHLSSGELLRDEVEQGTALGEQVRDIMARGELVSSALMVALMKKRMKNHPGKRVLLDGFPRSLENAYDLVNICGRPQLALHLVCDDTVLMERIMNRKGENREDDNFKTALTRLRTYHKFQPNVMEWLRQQHIPIVNLDCEGTPDAVWNQMTAIGKLMRPAVKQRLPNNKDNSNADSDGNGNGSSSRLPQEPDLWSSSSDSFKTSVV